MNTLKRFSALVLGLALVVVCFAGCHEKNEIAVKIGDNQFTSGYYSCALFFANQQAKSIVDEQLTESAKANVVYTDQKVNNVEYVKWVKDTAISTLKETAFVKDACKKANVTLTAEDTESAKLFADTQWEESGTMFEANGIGKETFRQYVADAYLKDAYFEHIYGKGGEKEISTDELKKQLTEHYGLINILTADFSKLKEDERDKKREKFKEYEKSLTEKTRTFEEIYNEVYKEENGEEHKHEEPKEGEKAPKDTHAMLISDTNTNLSFSKYDDVKDLKAGEVKIITLEEDAGLLLVLKKDVLEDPFYLEEYDSELRFEIKEEEFENNVKTQASTLKADVNDFAVNQFDVKKIVTE